MHVVLSSKAPGRTGIQRKSVGTCNCAWKSSRSDPDNQLESASPALQTVSPVDGQRQNANQVVVAIARELSAFMWAIAKQVVVPRTPKDDGVLTYKLASSNLYRKRRSPGLVSPSQR